ncbi:Enoyl-[acyl-carrier-protein] reductase [NADH] FabI [Buchnera aphidicola (Pterocallis alni)]|uniref:enoyl-ACP reductase FabI n=1 Tax=Buchnera aphidicola TaxID=9 RepID=UPI00346432AC
MHILQNKKILVTGVLNKWSISYGIAQSLYEQGASLAFTCINKKNKKKIQKIAKQFNSDIVITCNLFKNHNMKKLFFNLSKYWNKFDGFVHSLAYASNIQLQHNYIKIINKHDFNTSHNITSYSLISMIKECKNKLNKKSSIVTLTYLGSNVVIPYYNIMGLAKASLESNVRYIANLIGIDQIRINAISAGVIKTTSSYNLPNLNKILSYTKKYSPIRRLITIKEIGNTAAFLFSNLSSGITGQIIFVDGGLSISNMNHLY